MSEDAIREPSQEEALRFELMGTRHDMNLLIRVMRSWLFVAIAIILAAWALFVAYVSAAGLSAIRQNTVALNDVAAVSKANRDLLESVRRDLENTRLRGELTERQLDEIGRRLGLPPRAGAKR